MALMHLAARWSKAAGSSHPHLVVATVDHGLRPASAKEAAWVAERANELGLAHETLTWSGPKPKSRIQEHAREARYALLAALAERVAPAPTAIAVAHHRDDQAETLLMRLARGSGIGGLAAMRPARALAGSGVTLIRPLLSLPKARLIATLQAMGQSWIEDPSNEAVDFERVRLRKARASLETAGLTNEMLASSARRLARANAALESVTSELQRRTVRFNDGAYAAIDAGLFAHAPEELRLRVLQRILSCFGGTSPAPRLSQVETLVERLATRQPRYTITLGGCLLHAETEKISVFREPGRQGLESLRLEPGQRAIWDGRFRIAVDPRCPYAINIRAVTANLLTQAKNERTGARKDALPRNAALTLPAAWHGDRLLAPLHPALSHLSTAESPADILRFVTTTFLGPTDHRQDLST
jgi:tRNA(Ile)-lysidine synthase